MRAILAAGGTAGHVNPAIAIANEIMRHQPDSTILFVGCADGMEKHLVTEAGYNFYHIEVHSFARRLNIKGILFNIRAAWHVMKAGRESGRLFRRFKPDIVIGCGGYVSGPVVRRAARMGIPTAIHEQNSFPGITTRLLSNNVDVIMTAGEDAVKRLDCPEKCVVTGNPIRQEFFSADRNRLRREWNVGDRACVVSFGGSLGARTVNQAVAHFMKRHAGSGSVYHIHATGQNGENAFHRLLEELGVDAASPDLRIVQYIDNMPQCFAAADLIIARSGAITISEIAAAGKASVLIPSPNVTENHQFYNAKTLSDAKAAILVEEADIEFEALAVRLYDLVQDRQKLRLMGVQARSIAVPNSARRIYEQIVKIAN